MLLDLTELTPSKPTPRSRWTPVIRILLVLVGVGATIGGAKAWELGYLPGQFWEAKKPSLATVEVDRGELAVFVTETGTMESAANTTVRCQVEALIGTVGGTSKSAGGSGQGGAGGAQSTGGASSATSKTQATAASKTGSSSAKASTKTSSSATAATPAASTATSSTAASGTAAASGSGGSGGSTTTMTVTVTPRPTIRSFSFVVAPYVSLRPAAKAASSSTPTKGAGGMAAGGGGGGGNRGGGGGGGGGGGMGGNQEKAGSTRIIMIKPEGTPVSAGEVVCELDADAFRDALLAQRIKYLQAESWVEQAKSILEVNEISLREYRDGIYPQDLLLIRQYLNTCRKEEDRARKNLEWSRPVFAKGFRTRAQYEADVLNLKRSEIALAEAERMEERLIKYTGPKIIKGLLAKLEANRSDKLAQEAAFQIERDRRDRLERMVANCTLRAPHEGIVVYAVNATDMFRPATTSIQEGATVREGQAIFELPDDNKMRVRAKVNESKVGLIQVGQKASIRVDAFPDKPLVGTVTEVTAIPAPANGPSSDIKVYFANVNIDTGGFDGLRPGLSAEVSFFVDSRPDSTRVPLQSIRWVDRLAYAAIATAQDGSSYRWQPVEIGLMNQSYAEVLTGLKPGDRIVAQPESLPMPPASTPPTLQASVDGGRVGG